MISYRLSDDVAWITIDRPEKANAINPDGWRELAAAVERADREAHVAVLEGAGDEFSAGDDIGSLADWEGIEDVLDLAESVYGAYHGIEQVDVPVIAAVDGLAYGGGLELVIACDLAVATTDATFALPEAKIGAYPPFAVERICRTAGRKRMMELFLTGDSIDAETARDWGLVNRVVPSDEFDDEVAGFIDQVTALPPRSLRIIKRYANRDILYDAERERMIGAFAELFLSGVLEEGVAAFVGADS